MKKYLYYAIIPLIIAIILFSFKGDFVKAETKYQQSKAECVMEVNSGRVLYSNNENLKVEMASTTKILTAITVIDNFDISKEVVVPKSATGIEGSSVYLKEGEKLTVKELLYCLMLRSGNDSAECLAQTLINRDDFIKLMNKTAKKIGANSSNFVNPHGLSDKNHYTTAYDLCLISCYAMKNATFKEIVSTKRIEVSNDFYDYNRVLINKNKFLFNYDGATGVKTGFTKSAGRCLVSSANKNGMEVVSVVINSPQMWERSTELIDNAYNNYKIYKILNRDEFSTTLYGFNNKIMAIELQNEFSFPLNHDEVNEVSYKIDGKTLIEFAKNPKEIAVFEIFIKNKLIFSQNIFTILYR